jgi:nitroreductase
MLGTDLGLWDVMSTMRAMRRLKPDPVPRELIEQLVQAATWAPSASNGQAYSWVVVTERDVMKRLEPIWARCYELYWATVGPTPGETMNAEQVAAFRNSVRYQREHFVEIPALLVACYAASARADVLLREWRSTTRAIVALGAEDALGVLRSAHRATTMAEAASVYPAVQNLLLTARALGLGATLTTLHLILEARFKQILGIPSNVKTFAVIPVGWPRGRFGPVRRRQAADITHWDHW